MPVTPGSGAGGGGGAAGDGPGGDRRPGGALGSELAEAIRDYNATLSELARAEAAVEVARREASESRARLTALTTGARLSGTRVLVAVEDAGAEEGSGEEDPDRQRE